MLQVYLGSDGRVRSALVKTEDGDFRRPGVELAPMFSESVFREKTGPAMLAPVNCEIRNSNSKVTDETYNSKDFKKLSPIYLENSIVSPEIGHPKKHHPLPFLRSTCPHRNFACIY